MSDMPLFDAIDLDGSDYLLQCPECKHKADLDDWDVLGSDDDKLFCPECGREVVPVNLTLGGD